MKRFDENTETILSRLAALCGAVVLLLGLGATTGYPDTVQVPTWLGIAALVLSALMWVPVLDRRHRRADALVQPAFISTIVLIGVAAAYTGHLEGPVVWLAILPALWLARCGDTAKVAGFLLLTVAMLAYLAVSGERDEIWRAILIGGVAVWISLSELRNINRMRGRQAELEEARARLGRALESVDTARGEERHVIAGDLHDFPLQRVISSIMATRSLERALANPPERDAAARIIGQLQEAVDGIRRIIHGLIPDSLAELSLVEALTEHAAMVRESFGIRITVRHGTLRPLPPHQQLVAFRVVAEAMTNTAKHSQASAATVDISEVDGCIEARIADSGTGLPRHGSWTSAPSFAGTGLLLIESHVRAQEGTLRIDSTPEGTTVSVRLPLDDEIELETA